MILNGEIIKEMLKSTSETGKETLYIIHENGLESCATVKYLEYLKNKNDDFKVVASCTKVADKTILKMED